MVEEKFKIGVSLEVEPQSIADITRKLKAEIKKAFEVGIKEGSAQAKNIRARSDIPAARSARESLAVKSDPTAAVMTNLAKQVERLEKTSKKGTKETRETTKKLAASMNALNKAIKEAQTATRQRSRSGSTPQQGASNQDRQKQIDTAHATGGRRLSSGSGITETRRGKTADPADRAGPRRERARQSSARDNPPSGQAKGVALQYQKAAEAGAMRINKALDSFARRLEDIFPGRGREVAKAVGLPSRAEVGEGATIQLKGLGTSVKTALHQVEIFDGKLKHAGDTVSSFIDNLLSSGNKAMAKATRQVSAQRPERAINTIRGEVRDMLGKLPDMSGGRVRLGVSQGGQGILKYKPTADERKRLENLKDENDRLVEINKIMSKLIPTLEGVAGAGIEIISSLGLIEGSAIPKGGQLKVPGTQGETSEVIEIPIMVRDLVAQRQHGARAMRPERGPQYQQVTQVLGGVEPQVMGRGERQLSEAGMTSRKAGQYLNTALVKLPEGMEDQIPVLESALHKFTTIERSAITLRKAAEGIIDGMELASGQLMGFDAEGKEVKFDMGDAIKGKIVGIKKVIEGDIEGFRIEYEKIQPMRTAGKLITAGGAKGRIVAYKDLGKDKGGKAIEAVLDPQAMARRGDIADAAVMMAHRISDELKDVDPQKVSNEIDKGLREFGLEIHEAISRAAKQFGLEDFKGTSTITGGLIGKSGPLEALTGRMHFGVAPGESANDPAIIRDRFMSSTDIQSMKGRGVMEVAVQGYVADMEKIAAQNADLIMSIRTLGGAVDVAAEGLKVISPGEFEALPEGKGDISAFTNTLLDAEKATHAFAMALPTKGGGTELLRVPGVGKLPGQRTSFKSALGAQGADKITRLFDRIRETANSINIQEKGDPTQSAEALQEAATLTDQALNKVIASILKLGTESEEGGSKFKNFMAFFGTMIDSLQGPSGIQYKSGGQVRDVRGTASEYLASQKSDAQKMYAVRDILGKRTAGGNKVARAGAMFDPDHVNILTRTMNKLNVVMGDGSDASDYLYNRLDKLKEQLRTTVAGLVVGTGSGSPQKHPTFAQTGAGVSSAPYAKAMHVPKDISGGIEAATSALMRLGEAGRNVSGSLAALDQIKQAQPESVIPAGSIIINEKDFQNWVGALSKTHGMRRGEVSERLLNQGVVSSRYPTTGAGSFQPGNLIVDKGQFGVPQGSMAVPGVFSEGEAGNVAAAMLPLKQRAEELTTKLKALGGVGEQADHVRAELTGLQVILEKFNNTFDSAIQNLDFDGDHILLHANVVKEASSRIATASEMFGKVGINMSNVLSNVINKESGAVTGGGLQELGASFRSSIKGRPAGFKSGVLAPDTLEQMGESVGGLTRPKMSVGLATDSYNKFMMSIAAGLEETDDVLNIGLTRMMLNINESLKQKHEAAGVPSLKLPEMIAKGQLGNIFDEMGQGGMFESLGNFNQDFRKELEGRLMALKPVDLASMMKDNAMEHLIPKGGITSENWNNVIEQVLDASDMKGTIKRIHEALRNAMRKTLKGQGVADEDVEGKLEGMLKKGKRGIPGFNIDQILEHAFPQFMGTRDKFVREISKKSGLEQLGQVLKILPKVMADQLDVAAEDGASAMDPKKVASKAAEGLRSYLNAIRGQFETKTPQEWIAGGKSPDVAKRMRGRFLPGKGEHGTIEIADTLFEGFRNAITELEMFASGKIEAGPENIHRIAKAINEFLATFAHEGAHQIMTKGTSSKDRFKDPVNRIMTSLESKTGKLAPYREQIYGAIDKKIPGAGGMDPAKLRERRGQELIAYQTRPEELFRSLGDLPADALEFLKKQFMRVSERSDELVGPAMAVAQDMKTTLMESLIGALKGGGVAGGVAGGVVPEMDYAGREMFNALSNKLGQAESAMFEGQLKSGTFKSITGAGGLLEAEKGDYKIPGVSEDINKMLAKARGGEIFQDPAAAQEMKRDLMKKASAHRRKTKGPAGDQAYQKIIKEFQASEAQFMLNRIREKERDIKAMRDAGGAATPKFRQKLMEFNDMMMDFQSMIESSFRIEGKGRGRMMSLFAGREGEIYPETQAFGAQPPGRLYQEHLQTARGTGKEAQEFENTEAQLKMLLQSMEKGGDAASEFRLLFERLAESPKTFSDNMSKAVEVLAKWSKLSQGGSPALAHDLEEVSKEAKVVVNSMGAVSVATKEDIMGRMKPRTKKVLAAGAGAGAEVGELPLMAAIDTQYKEFIAMVKQRNAQLNELIKTPGFEAMGVTPDFEPMRADIIDPTTGQTLQKVEAKFKKMGGTMVTVMNQIGEASNRTGKRMKDTLRRVVQWGFATGIIYGTMRAFRALGQVMTEVQNRMFNLKKVMDTTTTDFGAMQDAAVGMARNFGIAIEEVLDGMVVYGQQGLEMNEILERTNTTMLAVNVTTLSATDATEALTAAMKIFGDEVESSMSFVDAWGSVASKHAITAKDLADSVKRAGAAAGTAGLDFEDMMGIVTAIGATTRQSGKEIGTSVKFMMRAMRRPTAQRQLKGIGIESMTPGGDLRPAMDVLGDVADQWGNLSKAQQLAIAQAMAGVRHYNSFIVLMEQFDEALEASADASNSQGFALRKNALAMQTFGKQIQVLRESLKSIGLEVGKAILPAATSGVKAIGFLVDMINLIPGSFMQAGVIGAAGLLGIHKAADVVSDSLDAMLGYSGELTRKSKMGDFIKKHGMLVGAFKLPKMAWDKMVSGASGAGAAIIGVTKAITGWGTAASIAATGGVAVLIAGLAGLLVWWNSQLKTGKEVADQMYNQIGQSQDLANKLKSQSTQVARMGSAYAKLNSAIKNTADLQKLNEAIREDNFKGPSKAAQEFGDVILEVSLALAKIDAENIAALGESGEFILSSVAAFDALTVSAIDAQNAITAAMQVDVISAFANEMSEATTMWQSFLGFLGEDTTPAGVLKGTTEKLNKVLEERRKLQDAGLSTIGTEESLTSAVNDQLAAREAMLVPAMELKRVLEEMPRFEDMGLAADVMGPKFRKAIEEAIPTGVFGRGASVGSVMFKQMSKNVGMGGMTDYRTGTSGALVKDAMMERGIRPDFGFGGAGIESGEMAALTPGLAGALGSTGALIGQFNAATGEAVYGYVDSITGTWETISMQALENMKKGLGDTADIIIRFTKAEIDNAAAQTEKLLTLQFVGAAAGIRVPKNMPDLGLSRAQDMTAQQRSARKYYEEMQRLADIQEEMSKIQQEYTEDMEGAGDTVTKTGRAIKTLTSESQDLIMALQLEGFNASMVLHYDKAIQELTITMEQSAQAVKDMQIEEETRIEFLKHSGGAMAGLAVRSEFDFGKTRRELSAQEKLQQRSPGFRNTLDQISVGGKQRDILVKQITDVRKQRQNALAMIKDLEAAREGLITEQDARRNAREREGFTPAQQESLSLLDRSYTEILAQSGLASDQLNTQFSILRELELQTTFLAAESPEERKEIVREAKKTIGEKNIKQLMTLMKDTGTFDLAKMIKQVAGFGEDYEVTPGKFNPDTEAVLNELGNIYRQSTEGRQRLSSLQAPGIEAAGKFGEIDIQKIKMDKLAKSQRFEEALLLSRPDFAPKMEETAKGALIRKTEQEAAAAGMTVQELAVKKVKDEENKSITAKIEMLREYIKNENVAASQLRDVNGRLRKLSGAGGIAVAAQEFADSIDNLIFDFKKEVALDVTKRGSVLEGPFARVGQPGFKTSFEQRREEIEKKMGTRGTSREERKQLQEELKQVEFDEKEARITEKQKIETNVLRQQQGMAEKIRSQLYDVLEGGKLKGTVLEGPMKNYMSILGEELATSEQGEMRGGKLMFKGIPALAEAMKLAERAKQAADAKMRESNVEDFKAGMDPAKQVLDQLLVESIKHTALMGEAGKVTGPGSGGGFKSFSKGGGLATGMVRRGGVYTNQPNVRPQGVLANNLEAERQARMKLGNATASNALVVSTETTAGGTQIPGSRRNRGTNIDPGQISRESGAEANRDLIVAIQAVGEQITITRASQLQALEDQANATRQSAADITDKLGERISVEVVATVPTTVDNLSEVTDAFNSAGLGGIGADVTAVNLRLDEVDGLLAPGGTIDQNIENSTSGLENIVTATRDQVTTLDNRVADSEARVDASEVTVTAASDRVNESSDVVTTLSDTISEAVLAVSVSTSSVEAFRTSLTDLSTNLETESQARKVEVQNLDGKLKIQETKVNEQDSEITRVKKKTESALSLAQRAQLPGKFG